jgi:hypothetical protein
MRAEIERLVEMSDKEIPASGIIKNRGDLARSQPVGVRLDDTAAPDAWSDLVGEMAVVPPNRREVDRQCRTGMTITRSHFNAHADFPIALQGKNVRKVAVVFGDYT